MADFYQMQAEVRELRLNPPKKQSKSSVPTKEPAEETIFLVAAWHKFDGGWSLRRQSAFHEYSTREAAERAAGCLYHHWSNPVIIEIKLPGAKSP
jgi:hypothetical protein